MEVDGDSDVGEGARMSGAKKGRGRTRVECQKGASSGSTVEDGGGGGYAGTT